MASLLLLPASAPLGWELCWGSSWEVRTREPCLPVSAWFCHLSLFMSLPLATLPLSPIVPLSSSVSLFLAVSAAPSARCLLNLTVSHLCLSQTPDHSSLGLAHPFLLSAFFLRCLSV